MIFSEYSWTSYVQSAPIVYDCRLAKIRQTRSHQCDYRDGCGLVVTKQLTPAPTEAALRQCFRLQSTFLPQLPTRFWRLINSTRAGDGFFSSLSILPCFSTYHPPPYLVLRIIVLVPPFYLILKAYCRSLTRTNTGTPLGTKGIQCRDLLSFFLPSSPSSRSAAPFP